MRVVVSGASGYVGSHAVVALRAAGHEVVLLVRSPEKARKVLASLGVAEPCVFHEADVRDAGAVRAGLEKGEAVLHAAAVMGVTGHGADLVGANVVGVENVLGQAAALGLDPIVHVSTTAVFVPPDGPVISTDSPLASPRNDYGKTKILGERYARELQDSGAPVTIVYPGGVAGPHQPTLDSLMEGFIAGMTQGWPISSGGLALIDVRDLAVVLARCIVPGQDARRYLLGGHFLLWAELVDLLDEITGTKARRLRMPARVLTAMGALLDGIKRIKPIDYPLTRDAADIIVSMVPTDDAPTLEALGVRLRPARETLADSLRWLVQEGHLAPGKAGYLAQAGQN